MRHFLFVLAGLFLMALPTLAQEGYRLNPGDVLRVEVLEDPSLNRNILVLPDGRVSIPTAGSLQAEGLTVEQIQANVIKRLAGNFAVPPNVFVGVASLAPPVDEVPHLLHLIDVYVMGEAAAPGKYEVEPGTTLLQFIALSGGFSPYAATKRIQLRRVSTTGVAQVITVNYHALERGASVSNPTVLAPGDVVIVPSRRLFE
jgi:polysaccharide biosynthesis/export protein